MDPDDRLRSLLGGMECTVCGATIPPDAVRLLAQRDDLMFLQLGCAGCGSTTLGMVIGETDDGDDRAVDGRPDPDDRAIGSADAPPDPSAPPLTRADVEAMHELLAGHHGSLRSLLRDPREGGVGW